MDRHAWEQPGTFEVGAGVYRIPLPLPGDHLKAVNVYAIADGDHVVLIDSGWAMADAADVLGDALGRIGYGLGDVREFLVTHLHRDHYTQAVALRRRHGTPIALGEGERLSIEALMASADRPGLTVLLEAGASELYAAIGGGRPDPDDGEWEAPDRWLSDGLDIALSTRTLRVIATPGHTRGHVIFHDAAAGALFAGDHVLPHITPSIGLERLPPESPLRDYLASLELVRRLPDSVLLPAHGPAMPSTRDRVDELLDHHERRLTATADAVEAGASSGFEVASALTWTRHGRRLDELDIFNQYIAVEETMAHLTVLVERGWLASGVIDGIARFRKS